MCSLLQLQPPSDELPISAFFYTKRAYPDLLEV